MAALNNQIYQIIRGHRATDDYKLAKDELCRTLNIDWNTTRAPLVPDEEFINKARVNTVENRAFCWAKNVYYIETGSKLSDRKFDLGIFFSQP